jgi:hypothetical protein
MEAISRLCERCVLLEKGSVVAIGPTQEIIGKYIQLKESIKSHYENENGPINEIVIKDSTKKAVDSVPVGIPWAVNVSFTLKEKVPSFMLAMSIRTTNNVTVRTTWSSPMDMEPGKYVAKITDPKIHLSSGVYSMSFGLSSFKKGFEYLEDCVSLKIVKEGADIDSNRVLTVSGAEIIVNPMDIEIKKEPFERHWVAYALEEGFVRETADPEDIALFSDLDEIWNPQILEQIGNMWKDLPIKNKWEDVVDNAVSSGSSPWQLYGSQKPGHTAYKLKYNACCWFDDCKVHDYLRPVKALMIRVETL